MRPFAVITGPVISSGFDQHQRGATIKNNRINFTLCVKLGGGGQQNLVCEPQKEVILGVDKSEKMDGF